jgi:hypothetical protein
MTGLALDAVLRIKTEVHGKVDIDIKRYTPAHTLSRSDQTHWRSDCLCPTPLSDTCTELDCAALLLQVCAC